MTNETSAIPETDGGATTLNTIVTSLPGQVEESVILNAARTMKVLVVDDSRTLRRLLVRELNIIGITNITEAGDGEEALVKAREASSVRASRLQGRKGAARVTPRGGVMSSIVLNNTAFLAGAEEG